LPELWTEEQRSLFLTHSVLASNNFSLICKGSKDIATDMQRKSPFSTTSLSFYAPLQGTLTNIRIIVMLPQSMG